MDIEHQRVIEDQKRLAKLWLDVCQEQEDNGYDWEKTKEKCLSDWERKDMTVDWWTAYMESSFRLNALQHLFIDMEGKTEE